MEIENLKQASILEVPDSITTNKVLLNCDHIFETRPKDHPYNIGIYSPYRAVCIKCGESPRCADGN